MKNGVIKQSKVAKLLVPALVMPWLVACGGGSDTAQSATSAAGAAVAAATPSNVDDVREIDGGAIKGVISQGLVTAYKVESLAGRFVKTDQVIGRVSRTNDRGAFKLSIPRQYTGPMVVEISADGSTRMRCDVVAGCEVNASGARVSFGENFPLSASFRLRAAIDTATQNKVYVTPMSHLAVASASAMADGLSATNITKAYRQVEASFDFPAYALDDAPADLTRLADGSSASSIKLGVVNAAFLAMVDEATWGDITEVLADASARIVASGSIPEVSPSDDISVESVLFAAQGIATDLRTQTTSATLLASIDQVVIETTRSYTEVVGTTIETGTGSTGTGSDSTGTETTAPVAETSPVISPAPAPVVRSARLAWTAPLTRENGESLAMSDIKGYVIVYGSTAGNLEREVTINDAYTTQYEVAGLDAGSWYFAVKTIDRQGQVSKLSSTVTKTL